MTKKSERLVVNREYVTCDICGKRLDRHVKCPGCRRDVCESCGVWWRNDPWTRDDNGDYPTLACQLCDSALVPFTRDALAIQEDAGAKIDGLKEAWELKCREQ